MKKVISLSYLSLAVILSTLLASPAYAERYQFLVLSQTEDPINNVVITGGQQIELPQSTTAEMDQVNRTFSPYVLSVSKGQAVSFPNSDDVRHHVYSFSPAKQFELRLYSGHPEAPILFDKPGTVVLGCNIHDNMVGYIYISDREYRSQTDQDGKATMDTSSALNSVTLWHPALSLDSQATLNLTLSEMDRNASGTLVIQLDIPTPEDNPQIISNPADKFDRFKPSR